MRLVVLIPTAHVRTRQRIRPLRQKLLPAHDAQFLMQRMSATLDMLFVVDLAIATRMMPTYAAIERAGLPHRRWHAWRGPLIHASEVHRLELLVQRI